MNISETKILITGGGRGIGNYLAQNLAGKASKVFILDNNEELLSSIKQDDKLMTFTCDVTNPESVKTTINGIFQEHGGVNVLINNAGIIHNELLINFLSKEDKKHSISNWNKIVDVNLNAVFYVTSSFVENMVAKKMNGVIINISSISAQGNVGQSAYSATKAAVEALTKTWSKELGMFKIRSTCIAPGFFETPSTRESLNENMLNKWQKSVPLARLGNLSELESAVEFIIQNDYFNGKILKLDGGLTI
jgi:3-oxoacyl-[acyl-carrier protein] reductase